MLLNPIQACFPTRSGRNPAVKARWTRSTFDPSEAVDGVTCQSEDESTHAASTISPVALVSLFWNRTQSSLPLFLKVRQALPVTPPTSSITIVVPRWITVTPAAPATLVGAGLVTAELLTAGAVLAMAEGLTNLEMPAGLPG